MCGHSLHIRPRPGPVSGGRWAAAGEALAVEGAEGDQDGGCLRGKRPGPAPRGLSLALSPALVFLVSCVPGFRTSVCPETTVDHPACPYNRPHPPGRTRKHEQRQRPRKGHTPVRAGASVMTWAPGAPDLPARVTLRNRAGAVRQGRVWVGEDAAWGCREPGTPCGAAGREAGRSPAPLGTLLPVTRARAPALLCSGGWAGCCASGWFGGC